MCSLEIKFRLRQLTGGFLKIDKIASVIIFQILTELESRNIGSLAFFNNSNLMITQISFSFWTKIHFPLFSYLTRK